MSKLGFRIPAAELGIIWRYFDGVSHALASRFDGGSSPGEENLTFLLCELLDEGMTARHLLEYPLQRAKEDLANADGGITLDVAFQTHEHTKHVEHHYSGADLGIVFITEHPYFGRSERAVLVQAKRLFPTSSGYSLNSPFRSFHAQQRDFLKDVESRFSAHDSVFYLWYSPSSTSFSDDEGKLIRSFEALESNELWDWRDLRGWHPMLDELAMFGWPQHAVQQSVRQVDPQEEEVKRAWRKEQPATRVSSLSVVSEVTGDDHAPRLISMYEARRTYTRRRRRWRWLAFEPLASLFIFGLSSEGIGCSSQDWLRLARGEKVAIPSRARDATDNDQPDLPHEIPVPRHSMTFTLRSSLTWPENLRMEQR